MNFENTTLKSIHKKPILKFLSVLLLYICLNSIQVVDFRWFSGQNSKQTIDMFTRPIILAESTADNLFVGLSHKTELQLCQALVLQFMNTEEREVSQLNYDWSMVARAIVVLGLAASAHCRQCGRYEAVTATIFMANNIRPTLCLPMHIY